MQHLLNGVVLLDKPKGISSQQAVSAIKRIFDISKAGHTGSLDVLATGLLPICLNEATKFSQFLLEKDKHYQVKARLGVRTSTLDAEGEILEQKPVPIFQIPEIEKVLSRFRGTIQQVPPMFSALKHKGKPLYALARKGIEIDRTPRTITLFRLELIQVDATSLTLNVHCSKGTYIRSLVDEIGLALGCGAYVEMLRRTSAGPYQENQMVTLEILQSIAKSESKLSFVQPIPSMFPDFPAITCIEEERISLQQGKIIHHFHPDGGGFSLGSAKRGVKTTAMACGYNGFLSAASNVVLFDQNQQFFGIAEWTDDRRLKAKRLLAYDSSQQI